MSIKVLLLNLIVAAFIGHGLCTSRKPIYVIGHQTNTVEEVIPFLEAGANVLESDVQFNADGTVKELYHGCPGDCKRVCNGSVSLPVYLKHLRAITDPSVPGSYYDQLVMQFFDLKLDGSKNKERSGREMVKAVLDHLWSDDEQREQDIRVLFYVNDIADYDVIRGILREFKEREQEHRLKDVGFDGGMDENVTAVGLALEELQLGNVWMGDGTVNCFSETHEDRRLKEEIATRDRPGGYIKKVYDWTVDSQYKMMRSLELGVDGIITNSPHRFVQVLHEPYYWEWFRVATPEDDPFEKYPGFD